MKLKNINALITGGSQGLGRTIAEHYLREGANVVLCARNEKELAATRDALAGSAPGRKVLAKACDVSNEAQVNELLLGRPPSRRVTVRLEEAPGVGQRSQVLVVTEMEIGLRA